MGRNRIQYTGVRLDGFINEDRDDGSAISGLFFFFFHLLSFPLSSSIPLRISRNRGRFEYCYYYAYSNDTKTCIRSWFRFIYDMF